MECIMGIACKDFSMIAVDTSAAQSIILMKDDKEKIYQLSKNLVMGAVGAPGDVTQFSEYCAKNIQLYKMRNGYEMSPKASATFIRRNIADSLRSRNSYHVDLLLAGCDEKDGPQLYYIDYLGSISSAPFAMHGYGGYFGLSVMDRYYKKDMTQDEGYELLKTTIKEIQKRLIINIPTFQVQVVTNEGIKKLPNISSKNEE